MIRWLAVCLAGAALGCAGADGSEPDPRSYAEGRLAVPGCESFEYGPCDIRDASCLENLAAIAQCLRGGREPSSPPGVIFSSQAEAEGELLSLYPERPAGQVNHFEVALTRFGLTTPGALSPMQQATRYAREWAAFYSNARQAVVVIEQAARLDPLSENVLLVHEMVHALQDAEHDLDAFGRRYRVNADADLSARCLIEGEARLQERRYFAARAGLDSAELDFERSFESSRDATELWLFEQTDLYSASQLGVPYAHGAAFAFGVWSEGGSAALRALFDSPPTNMREVLASAWGGEPSVALSPLTPPAEPMPPRLDLELGEPSLEASTALGAWAVYLLVQPRLRPLTAARELALSWRGDLLEVFAQGARETSARWQIELAQASHAAQLARLLADLEGVTATQIGARVTLLASP